MAAPTITGKGINRSVEAATANFVFSATAAGDYDSTVKIPAGATILGSATKANVIMAGGTNVTIKMGPAATGAAVSAAITTTDMNAALKQNFEAPVAPLVIAAANDGGVISITTTGTYATGDIDVTVFYVV